MRTRGLALACPLACVAAFLLTAVPSGAQSAAAEKPAVYTYVSEWAVPRAMWADYKKEDDADLEAMKKATEASSNDSVAQLYEEFLNAREATIIKEIRSVCGVSTSAAEDEAPIIN